MHLTSMNKKMAGGKFTGQMHEILRVTGVGSLPCANLDYCVRKGLKHCECSVKIHEE